MSTRSCHLVTGTDCAVRASETQTISHLFSVFFIHGVRGRLHGTLGGPCCPAKCTPCTAVDWQCRVCAELLPTIIVSKKTYQWFPQVVSPQRGPGMVALRWPFLSRHVVSSASHALEHPSKLGLAVLQRLPRASLLGPICLG